MYGVSPYERIHNIAYCTYENTEKIILEILLPTHLLS